MSNGKREKCMIEKTLIRIALTMCQVLCSAPDIYMKARQFLLSSGLYSNKGRQHIEGIHGQGRVFWLGQPQGWSSGATGKSIEILFP